MPFVRLSSLGLKSLGVAAIATGLLAPAGALADPRARQQLQLSATARRPLAKRSSTAAGLWELSAQLTGVQFPL